MNLLRIEDPSEQLAELDQIFKSLAPDIAFHVGNPAAQSEWLALPNGVKRENKFYYLIYKNQTAVGCLEVLRGYPNHHTAYIGLMVIHSSYQGQGLGSLAWMSAEATIQSWDEIRLLRLGVSESHEPAAQFWQKMGFVDTGIVQTATNVQPPVVCRIFEKRPIHIHMNKA